MSLGAGSEKALHLEQVLQGYVEGFSGRSTVARVFLRGLSVIGVGVRPLLDHFVFRTLQPGERVRELLEMGYLRDTATRVFFGGERHVEVYRNDCAPAVILECPDDPVEREQAKVWGDQIPYVMAVKVENIEEAAFRLEKQAIQFLRPPAGKREESLRQMTALPETFQGTAPGYMMFVERHGGDRGFYLPVFWAKD